MSYPANEELIESLCREALQVEPDHRSAFLEDACGGDSALQEEVLRRLRTTSTDSATQMPTMKARTLSPSTGDFADAATVGISAEEQDALFRPQKIGPYRILHLLGEGGMGAVYLAARDDDQYKKQVAIKLLKPGMGSDFVIRRFRNERQILASLDHPNIARLLDGGTTRDGLPYFVMEYIEGEPINRYCDRKALATIERLKLFQQVCAAVHYAHQNLVIHRDIKPSNILVTAGGTPKLLDFGIAKILNPELSGQTIEATAAMARMMTPEYASPEQVKGEQITTASDIYSLGVLLYQLLTGHRPYRLKNRTPQEILRVVCEQEPERPSTIVKRVSTVTGPDGTTNTTTPESVSSTREGHPERLHRRLRGDLDNIVLMAMRKEPSRRYSSVDQFSNDLQRHLDGRPVIARKDTLTYRAGKFVSRNKGAAIAALLVIASLIAGMWMTSVQKARAEQRFKDVRTLANTLLFDIHDSIKDLAGSTPAREKLVTNALGYLDSLAAEAGDDLSLRRELAGAYLRVGDIQGNPFSGNIGDTAGAIASYSKALALREEIVRREPENRSDRAALARVHGQMAHVYWVTGDTKPALEAYQKAISMTEELIAEGEAGTALKRNLWEYLRRYAYAQAQAGNLQGAIASANRGREVVEALAAENPGDPETPGNLSASYSLMAEALAETGDYPGSLEYFRKALDIDEKLAAADPTNAQQRASLAVTYANLGDLYSRTGDWQIALTHYRKGLAIHEPIAAADPSNAQARRNLAVYYTNVGRTLDKLNDVKSALDYHRKAAAALEALPETGPENVHGRGELCVSYTNIALALARNGDAARALEYGNRARTIAEELFRLNPANIEVRALEAYTFTTLGRVYATAGLNPKAAPGNRASSLKEARTWFERGLEILSELRAKNAWASPSYGVPEEVSAEIAKVDEALAELAKQARPAK
jgi:serine/threonine protein kinase/tetratricopeptide (TPR) repeat protein